MLIMLAFWEPVRSQPQSFRHYQVETGLSNNAIICSIQDPKGFMWFGTRDGLNRFDGYNFKSYHFKENNLIHALCVDIYGQLFAATEKDVYSYDLQSDSFKLLFSSKNFYIDELIGDRDGKLWFNAGGVLSYFDPTNHQLISHVSWSLGYVSALCLDGNGIVWIGTGSGKLRKYNKLTEDFKEYDIFSSPNSSGPRMIEALKFIKGKILIGTFQGGVGIFEQRSLTYRDIHLSKNKFDNLIVRCFLQVTSEEIWIGCESGIYIYNILTGEYSLVVKNSGNSFSLSDDVIYSLTKDREGGVWVGTYFGGLSYFPKQYTPFKKYFIHSAPQALSGNIVRDITQDRFGNIWICTEDGGVNKIANRTGRVSYLQPDGSKKGISYRSTHGILPLGDEVWTGTFQHGLNIINIQSESVIRHYFASSKRGLDSDFPYCLYQTKSGEVLVGSDNGLYSYNNLRDTFTVVPGFPNHGLYTSIMEDQNGTLWLARSGDGLLRFDRNSKRMNHFKFDPTRPGSLVSNKVNSIFKDSGNNLWIATELGLCKWNPRRQEFIRYGRQNGFPSDFILCLLEDERKILWISTTKGLVSFNPESNKVLAVYTTANGIISDQFNFNSAFKAKDGTMYFGSAKGLISFNPEQFGRDAYIPPVFITALQVNGQYTSSTGPIQSKLRTALFTNNIILKYDQSSLNIEFSALGYTAPQAITYAYQLEGLSDKWTYISQTNKLNFTKLTPGNYKFKIKASSTSGVWDNKFTILYITILPPWWKTSWAFMCYFIAILSAAYFIFKSYHKRMREKNLRQLEKMEIEREKEILEAKIDFYTEVAHEIRTPLTLIKIPLGKVIRNTEGMESIANSLKIIGGNTDRLIELSNQLLDFRQTELKRLSLNFQSIDIVYYLKEICENFSEQAEQNQIHMEIVIPENHLMIQSDLEAFKKIIYNLISNAIKYASKLIIITVAETTDNKVIIFFRNDGPIIPSELEEKVFEPFFRIRETDGKTGSGIGLALAHSLAFSLGGNLEFQNENNEMNIFYLTLPLNFC